MNKWIISDTHFYHSHIIEYCKRPFKDVEEMNSAIIKNWNSVVGKDDLVYFLGDFALMYGDKEKFMRLVQSLNGKKCMIMGNHDTKKPQYYIELGFIQATRKPIVIDDNIILSHEPPKFISKDYIYFFGHVHDKHCEQDDKRNCFCVCAERLNYTPYNLDKLIKKIDAGKKQEVLNELTEEKTKLLIEQSAKNL